METIRWSPEMSLGVPALDVAHQEFLQDLMLLDSIADEQFGPAFHALVAKIEADFHEEEEMMEDLDYPGIRAHCEQHARVLGALHHIEPRVMEGDIALGRDAVGLLPQWFTLHLATMDTALAFAAELDSEERGKVPGTARQ
ncbi:hemerythrin domain-containing protein [Noviherbaspirillum sp.]|uniref:bacteriohemerythrin n=1 Tax=Noviherbaspirillum sp. TaxID=1926288 RepID=UPI002B4838D5|nr:hemerythrin domain-containing protein [Noviherbaspirillum sp.]HJV82853.1 hemerythrin domain-containing protein [Noviherbaspirillum sp.]